MNVTNCSFQAAFTCMRMGRSPLQSTGVCTLVVPKLRNAAFLIGDLRGIGAEGENSTTTCFTGFFTYFANMLTK